VESEPRAGEAGGDLPGDFREVQRQLARSEQRLEQVERVAHIGTWEWDPERNVVAWSDELYRIYGLDRHQFLGSYEDFLARIHPEDRQQTVEAVFEAFRGTGAIEYDHRIVRPDGGTRLLHTRGEVVKDEWGKPLRMMGVCWDVTERWDATRALERSVSLLRAIVEATADGILVVDGDGRIAAHNKRFLALWHLEPGLVEKDEDAALLSAVGEQLEDPKGFMQRVRELYDHPDAESFDVLRFKDGRVFERYSGPQRLTTGIVGRVWSFRDVTERERLLRQALFLSEASRLLNSLEVEAALESVAQLALPYMGDACAVDLLADEGGPRRLLSIAREPAQPISVELPRAVFAGHSLMEVAGEVSYLIVPLLAHGALLGAWTFAAPAPRRYQETDLKLAQDLAERSALAIENARLYRRAREALSAREQFVSIAAHEIRGPITAMHLAVQSLRRSAQQGEADKALFGIIEREDRRLARFVDELLDVSRARSGRMHFHLEPVDLGEITRDVTARFGAELARAGSSLTTTVEGPVVGSWDRSRLDQIVTNLLSNAIKFGRGEPIAIEVSGREGKARLVVRDRGIGIRAGMLERIFQPFERAVSARHYGGLGLGLYIVRTIVEGLGGTVRATSAPGQGATFQVELPQEGQAPCQTRDGS
jgi:PAS domain S-box-containing protein